MNLDQSAIFSPCRRWRYTLRRVWGTFFQDAIPYGGGPSIIPERGERMVAFIGLNPSTADENKDDPTVRRCAGFAKRWGFGGMFMLNIFAFRSTSPKDLYTLQDPVGNFNDLYITQVIQKPEVSLVVACWGNHGAYLGRGFEVISMMTRATNQQWPFDGKLCHLGTLTIQGQPRHPLYLKGDLMPVPL